MVLKIKRAGADEYGHTMKLLLAGDPGSGKTRLSSTFPNPFIANADGGMMAVADRGTLHTDIESMQDLELLLVACRQPPKARAQVLGGPVSTVVLDTIDSIQKLIIEERKRTERKDTMAIADWGFVGDQLRTWVRNFRNLDLNVIFTCHIKTESDAESGQTFVKPALQGAMGDEIAAYVDVAALLRANPVSVVKNGQTVRVIQRFLQTGQDARHPWLKDRSGKFPVDLEVNLVDDGPRLLKAVFGGAPTAPTERVTTDAEAKAKDAAKVEGDQKAPTESTSHVTDPQPETKPEKTEPEKESVSQNEGQSETEPVAEGQAQLEEPSQPVQSELNDPAASTPSAGDLEAGSKEPSTSVETANGHVAEAPDPSMLCEICGDPIETEDQRDFALIRFRKRLDKKCFQAAKTAKK